MKTHRAKSTKAAFNAVRRQNPARANRRVHTKVSSGAACEEAQVARRLLSLNDSFFIEASAECSPE